MFKNVNKKLICIIGLALIFLIILFFLFRNDIVDNNKDIQITNRYVAYVKINPLIKIEYT